MQGEILPFYQFFLFLKSTNSSIEVMFHVHKPGDQYTNCSLIKTSKHCKIDFSEEVYERKQYLVNLTLGDMRAKFRIRGNMIGVKFNMKNRKDYAADLWACIGCGAVDTFLHLKWCPKYAEMREGKDLFE